MIGPINRFWASLGEGVCYDDCVWDWGVAGVVDLVKRVKREEFKTLSETKFRELPYVNSLCII